MLKILFLVSQPISKDRFIYFFKGTNLKIQYYTKNIGLFSFDAVVDDILRGRKNVMKITKVSDTKEDSKKKLLWSRYNFKYKDKYLSREWLK